MQYSFQTKQIDILFTAGQKHADKVLQIVNGSPKMCHVTQRRPLTMYYMLALEWLSFSRNV